MENRKIFEILFISILIMFYGCHSVDLEVELRPTVETDESAASIDEEEYKNEQEMHEFLVQEELKIQDIEPIVVYVEKPVYIPEPAAAETEKSKLVGTDATKDSEQKSTRKPEHYKNGTFFYQYNENFVYEIYAQPFHLTDIILEDGEIVLGDPLISEDDEVWELTANVARNPITGENIQHLFIKPAYVNLDSTMIIITDRRVYHFRIKSFKDTHMAMVKFTYPATKNVWATKKSNAAGVSIENEFLAITNPEFLSFDYKMKYGLRKPEFLPQQVYDDGQKTYIVVDDIVLHKQLPVLFNERNEILNYSVHKNVFVIPRLINKITIRLGKEKVTVEKKKTYPSYEEKSKEINVTNNGGE